MEGIDFSKIETLIKEKFHNQEGHNVDVKSFLEDERGTAEGEYEHFIGKDYQGTYDFNLSPEEVRSCRPSYQKP